MVCRAYVVKIASRCNLNCSYCYMYNKGDNSWRTQPKVMSRETIRRFLLRVREHHAAHPELKQTQFNFHGGEPLLAGVEVMQYFVDQAKEILDPLGIAIRFTVQTNGILINEEFCRFFYDNDFVVGISLDGPQAVNDANRVYHNGKGSFDDVIKGIEAVESYKDLAYRMGFIMVVNREGDPGELYEFYKQFGAFDFLLPDYTHDDKEDGVGHGQTHYADWLIDLFNRWFDDPDRPVIRFFSGIIEAVLGGDVSVDTIGQRKNELLVIETNGDYEAVDTLKICGEGFTKAGANVRNSTINEALETELASLFYESHQNVAEKCRQCPINQVCGGGYLPHRFSKQNGFNNPSVYCSDLMKLITHIQNRILEFIPKEVLAKTSVVPITFEEVQAQLSAFDTGISPANAVVPIV